MKEDNAELWFHGLPTEPDVKKVLQTWPPETLTVSAVIPCKDVAELLVIDVESNRFATVLQALRKTLYRDHNIIMKKGDGKLTVASSEERIRMTGEHQSYGLRKIKRWAKITYRTETAKLSDEMKSVAESQVRLAAAIRAAERTAPKRLKAPELDKAKQ